MKDGMVLNLPEHHILDLLNEGVYVTDRDRKIVYWNKPAERITGWASVDVLGSRCLDNILCHIDKDGHNLCGEEYCPLYRAMIAGVSSTVPIIVFAKARDGSRIPMHVSVAPVRDDSGKVVGGVETFRNVSPLIRDLERARQIQSLSFRGERMEDQRVRFTTHYVPHDIIGGDYFAIEQLDNGRYAFMLADVMGHGIAAALYTMHLYSLWEESRNFLTHPSSFLEEVSSKLCKLVRDDESYATGIYGLLDLENRSVTLCSAGAPPFFIIRGGSDYETVKLPGLPLGLLDTSIYDEQSIELREGDGFLFFTDGATEVFDAEKRELGTEGLLGILKEVGYPDSRVKMEKLEEKILKFSNRIRLDDDLTFLGIHFAG